MGNIDEQKLRAALSGLQNSGLLASALKQKDMNGVMSALPAADAEQLKKILSDKAAMEKLLSSREAQNLLKALKKDGE